MRREFVRKGIAAALALTVIGGSLMAPALGAAAQEKLKTPALEAALEGYTAYADEYFWLNVRTIGGLTTKQNSTKEIVLVVTNTRDGNFVFDKAKLEFEDSTGLTVTGGVNAETKFTANGESTEIRFNVKTNRFCDTGMRDFRLILSNDDSVVYTSRYFALTVNESIVPGEDEGGTYINSVDVVHSIYPENGFVTGSGNQLSLQVYNGNDITLKNVQVKLTLPDGIAIDNGSNVKNIGTMSANKTSQVTFNLVVESDVVDKNYVFGVDVTGLDSKKETVTYHKDFYIPVDGDGKKDDDGIKDVNTPQLMVNGYSYGGGTVLAGSSFPLDISFLNTSKQKLYNIKVVIDTAGGTFVPVNSSSSFYIESIGAGEKASHQILLSSAHDAEQAVTALKVAMTYEDADGGTYSADDTISIPVVQETRLVIDEIVAPYELYAGMEASAKVNFYNMGKTKISNLKIDAEGNFDVYDSNSTYVGNMESGAKDDYKFVVIPREVGPVEGTVIFTYEDMEGTEQRIEIPFMFEAMEMPVYDDPFMPVEPEPVKDAIPWSLIIALIVIILLIITFVVVRKVLKKKKEKALELEDTLFEIDEVSETDETSATEAGDGTLGEAAADGDGAAETTEDVKSGEGE